jgi:hypothetical protein
MQVHQGNLTKATSPRHLTKATLGREAVHWWTRGTQVGYEVGGGVLRLLIERDQQPWCPEFDGQTRVSSLQTGVFAGPAGSTTGQSRFKPELVVRQAQRDARLYTPQYGLIELRAKAIDDPGCMVALWMIGYEDQPERSAEICTCSASTSSPRPASEPSGTGTRSSSSSTPSAGTGRPPHPHPPRSASSGPGRRP